MGEEVNMSEYVLTGDREGNGGCDEDRVLEWEIGLPSGEDLAPLSHLLISPELASAFSISPEPGHTIGDVNRASERTLSRLRSGSHALSSNNLQAAVAADEDRFGSSSGGSDPKKKMKSDDGSAVIAMVEEADSGTENPSAKTTKKSRLVWTAQLHKRFIAVVAHLGLQNAVPKTIMQLMNVEGLTRENVASHLQKYRLYIKRTQGDLPPEAPSSSDQIFSSAPVPPQSSNNGSGGAVQPKGVGGAHHGMPIPIPYGAAPTPIPGIHVPVYGNIGMQGYHHHPQHSHTHNHYHQNHFHGGSGFESHQYTMQPREWPGKNSGSVPPYPSGGGGGGGANEK